MPPTAARSMIKITTTGEGVRKVVASTRGPYAVHPQVIPGGLASHGWAVTHIRSGLSIWSVREREEADAVQEWLFLHNPLPPDASYDEAIAWAGIGANAVDLAATLTALAPKYVSPEQKRT